MMLVCVTGTRVKYFMMGWDTHETGKLPGHLKATIFERLLNIVEYTKLSKEEQAMYNQDLNANGQ
jgi:hypothetical protein